MLITLSGPGQSLLAGSVSNGVEAAIREVISPLTVRFRGLVPLAEENCGRASRLLAETRLNSSQEALREYSL